MPLVEYVDRNVHLQSLYLLLSDPRSNIEQIFTNINILYPEFTEFSPENMGFDRTILISSFANRVYQQLRLADPYHPYNDLQGFVDLIFAAQQYHAHEMQRYLHYAIDQSYKAQFIANYSRNLPISNNELISCQQEVSKRYKTSTTELRLKINSMIYWSSQVLLIKMLLPLVNYVFLMPRLIIEQQLQRLNMIINIFEFGTAEFGRNYCDVDFEIFAEICAYCNEFEFVAWCIETGVRAPDSAFFKKMQIDFAMLGNYQAVEILGQLLAQIPSSEAIDLFKRINRQKETLRLRDSIYNVVKTQIFAMPIIMDTTPLLQLTDKPHAEIEIERETQRIIKMNILKEFDAELERVRAQDINEAIESLDYKTLNNFHYIDIDEQTMIVDNVVIRLQRLQKDGKYKDNGKVVTPAKYDEFVDNFAVMIEYFYCQVIDSQEMTPRLKISVLKCIARMDLDSYCRFSNENQFPCLGIAESLLVRKDASSEGKLSGADNKKSKAKFNINNGKMEAPTEEERLLQVFIDREYAENNYGNLHYWSRYDGEDNSKLTSLLANLIVELSKCKKVNDNSQLVANVLKDENGDTFLHVLHKHKPESMNLALETIKETKNIQLLYIIFSRNLSGDNIYNLLERDFLKHSVALDTLSNILLMIVADLSRWPDGMRQTSLRINDFFNNDHANSLIVNLITRKEYRALIRVLEHRYSLRNMLMFSYKDISKDNFSASFFHKVFGECDLLNSTVCTMLAHNYLYFVRNIAFINHDKITDDFRDLFMQDAYKQAFSLTPPVDLMCWHDIMQFSNLGKDADTISKSLKVMQQHFSFYNVDINKRNSDGINLILDAARNDAYQALRFILDHYSVDVTEGDVVWAIENIPSLRCIKLICSCFSEVAHEYESVANEKVIRGVCEIIESKKAELEMIFSCRFLNPEKLAWLQLHGVCLQRKDNVVPPKLKM